MRVLGPVVVVVLSLVASLAAAQTDEADPIPTDKVETERVRLVILDLVVLDSEGRTVPDLTEEDFEILVGGKVLPVDTLDVDCSAGALDDPVSVANPDKRPAAPASGDRRIVLAFDYLHLNRQQRMEVLDDAMEFVRGSTSAGDEILVAALNGGLRVEQGLTPDHDEVWRTLRRMQYDITLWQPSFFHLNESGFVGGLTTLFDVLGTVPGRKAVVLYTAMGDVPLDTQFQEIASVAAASRCSLYPVDAAGIRTDFNAAASGPGPGGG